MKNLANLFGGSKNGTLKKDTLQKSHSSPAMGSTTPRNTAGGKDDNKTYKKSVMMKEGAKIASWKKRMFICKRDAIYYYKFPKGFTEEDAEYCDESIFTKELECGVIPLANAKVVKAEHKKYKFCFDITPSATKRTYRIAATTEQEMNEWIVCLKPLCAGIHLLTDDKSASLSKIPSENQLSSNKTSSDTTVSPATPLTSKPLDQTPIQNRKSFRELDSPSSPAVVIASTRPLVPHLSTPDLRRPSNVSDALDSPSTSIPLTSPTQQSNGVDDPRESNASVDNHDANGIDESSKRQPILTEEDELDIALCAAEIFMKPEQERTPQEQAYVIAMQQYRQQLQDHMKKSKGIPEYGLASGTVIFSIPANERTEIEKEFVKELTECYFIELEKDEERFEVPVDLQHAVANRAIEIFAKPESERTTEEQAYVLMMNDYARDFAKFERKNGLEASHSLISATLLLPKNPEDQTLQDLEFAYELDCA